MKAAILSIGDELTLGQCVDTNSAWLAGRLLQVGVETIEHGTVADDRAAIARAIGDLASRVGVLLLTGGLGPTPDDLTREALGDVVTPGEPLATDEPALRRLRRLFARRGRPMPPSNRAQAMHPSTMQLMVNPHGTAPGLSGRHGDCLIYALPGPPSEMRPMFIRHVARVLGAAGGGVAGAGPIPTAAVHAFGLGESAAAERLGDLVARDRVPLVATTFSESTVTARIRGGGAGRRAEAAVAKAVDLVEERWWPYCFGRNGQTLAQVVGERLQQADRTLVTAESCTGGLLGKLIVDVPGSSEYYLGGWVTYCDDLKSVCLGVPPEVLVEHGAVSQMTARRMAEGALAAAGADYALAVTGVAGPEGGTPQKPVGRVHVGLARKGGGPAAVRSFDFPGDRASVRDRSARSALQILRFALLEIADDVALLWEAPVRDSAEVC